MIDLHTHTLLSDGELLPSEMVRRAEVRGYEAIALTDHVDASNIDFVLPRLVKVCAALNRSWKIRALPGVEITHAPIGDIRSLVTFARRHGARVVVVHGETVSEPVIPGTNRAAIEARCDILAHPGLISPADILLAKKNGVTLEITTRKSHSKPNKRLVALNKNVGARMVLDNDAHSDQDLVTKTQAIAFLKKLGLKPQEILRVFENSRLIMKKGLTKDI